MRKEADFVPNVHEHTIDARRRLNGNGQLRVAVPQPAWWRRYFKWETLTVAGKVIEKGWVVPQPLGIALLVIILGGVGSLYWRLTDRVSEIGDSQAKEQQVQREMLIRLDQKLTDKNAHDAEDSERMEKRLQNIDAVQTVLGRDLVKLQARRGTQ